MTETDEYERVAALEDLAASGHDVASVGGHTVALFHHEGEVYAVDNRCPHMGFPLSEGTVEDGILTCHWHHARFELDAGDTFDVWADDVQTFPTAVRDGDVYVDPDPERDVDPTTHWRNRLGDGMAENLSLVVAKAVIHLDDLGEGFHTPLETAIEFGTTYRADGWGRGLTTLAAMANLHGDVAHDEKLRAMYVGVREVADNCAGEPPRFDQYALGNEDLTRDRLASWFRETCEVRDADGAERCLRTAANVLSEDELAGILLEAATDHVYLNASHTVDFLNKACEVLDHLGWGHAEDVLAATVEQFTDARRAEETSSWTQPTDVAGLCLDARETIPDAIPAGTDRSWDPPAGFRETLLGDDPHDIDGALHDAVRNGASGAELAREVAVAALTRVARFSTSNEFADWNTVHHTLSYATAVESLAHRTETPAIYAACWDGAMSVYLDRFLNRPAAPVPEPDDGVETANGTADPADCRERLLDAFDAQGNVDAAARLVNDHFEAGGDPVELQRTLAEGLLREDADFHTLQHLEAGFQLFDRARSERERRLALIGPARYMAAHFPTRRSGEQTFDIARRLFRGEAIHES